MTGQEKGGLLIQVTA